MSRLTRKLGFRGFERVEEKEVVLEMPKGRVPLKCFVYSKKIHSNTG